MTMRVRRQDKRTWYVAVVMFVAVFLFVFLRGVTKGTDEKAEAASLANFDPGYIISDYMMGNYKSMTEAEIQAFLTSKNSCSNTNYEQYLILSANSSYKWHFENGHFVCLSEELFGDGEVIGKGETAAHIIWQAAQDYKINPQVLIVLLQKETSLITDTYPNDGDYRKATGYGCPDTAPCSSQYYGFKNQVRKAAALFHEVLTGGWTNYPLGNNYVQYNPASECGGSMVNIRSLATSALYRYTPYQPNASALAAGYGYGDECGAYGNRNFYLYFQDWFGDSTLSKIDTSVNESNAKDKLTWELYKAMLEETGAKYNLGEFDKKYSSSHELTRTETVDILWRIFGTKIRRDGELKDMTNANVLSRAAINWAYENEITKYYATLGYFSPQVTITRREMMIFLWRYAGQPEADVKAVAKVLKDFPSDDLGQKAVAWAYEQGITKYYATPGYFEPRITTTRNEAMIFLWRYAGQPVDGEDIFNDMPQDDFVKKLAIVWAYDNGVTKYYSRSGEFAPDVVATRNEAAIFISRAFGR